MNKIKEINHIALGVAQEFAKRVHKLTSNAVVKLYGSAVRGKMKEFSDIDIYVELPDNIDIDAMKERLSDIAWEVGFEYDLVIQEMIYKKSEVWDSPLRSSPYIKSVFKEGITL